MIGKDWINKDWNIKDMIDKDWIGKVCIVLKWIGFEIIGHKRFIELEQELERTKLEKIPMERKGFNRKGLDKKKIMVKKKQHVIFSKYLSSQISVGSG